MVRKLSNITPIDEFADKMTKDEIYDEYCDIWHELELCLMQFEDLEYALKTVQKSQETIKIEQVLDVLLSMMKERNELSQEHFKEGITIVCG